MHKIKNLGKKFGKKLVAVAAGACTLVVGAISAFAEDPTSVYDTITNGVGTKIRGVIELENDHINARYYKLFGLILSTICGGLFISRNKMYQTKLRNDTDWIIRKRKISKCYDTFSLAIDYYSESSTAFNGAQTANDSPENEKGA